jgi:hypothetical protein
VNARILAITAFVACGPSSSRAPSRPEPVVAIAMPATPLRIELAALVARGDVAVRDGDDGEWQSLAAGAARGGVREIKVDRQGAIVALGHGDAAGRLWLRAGSRVRLAQDDHGVHVALLAGRARLRRGPAALPVLVATATGTRSIVGDHVIDARPDGRAELIATGARPVLADWSLALERDEVGAGVGRLDAAVAANNDVREPLELRRLSIDVVTAGDVALTTIEHVFYNPTDRTLEGTFRFPVPDGAMLTGMAMEIAGKMMEGEIVEREKARAVYQEIVDEMQDPALLEWEEGNWFKLRVFPIEAAKDKRVVIRYTTPLVHAAAGWEYAFSLAAPDLGRPIGEVALTVDGKRVVTDKRVERGFDLAIPIAVDRVPAVMRESRADGAYVAVRVAADDLDLAASKPSGPRKVAIVIDTSRSALESRALADEVARTVLGELDERDSFAVIASDVTARTYGGGFQPLTRDAIDGAIAFVDAIEPDGASDLGAALRAAAALRPTDVIYVGDGIPTWGELRPAALADLASSIGAPIHGGLVGKGATTSLWNDLAGRSGGRATIVRRADDARRFALVAARAGDAAKLVDARIAAPTGVVAYPRHATTLYAGDDLVAVIRVAPDQPMPPSIAITGTTGGRMVRREIAIASPVAMHHVARRWAAHHLAALEADGASRDDIVAVSRDFGVLSRHTSLLVLENEEAYAKYQIERSALDNRSPRGRKQAAEQLAAASPQVTGGDLDTLGARRASLSPDEIQPGDPEIKIPAPRDARSVVVSFPFGETKLAVWDADVDAWMVRFLIDRDTPDGEYPVRVTITHADGRIEVLTTLSYTVDTQPPAIQMTVTRTATGYRLRARQVASPGGARRKDAERVEVVLPDGAILVLSQTAWGRFDGEWQTAPLTAPAMLRVVTTDRALNQSTKDLVVGR